jgi:hypothetical protein
MIYNENIEKYSESDNKISCEDMIVVISLQKRIFLIYYEAYLLLNKKIFCNSFEIILWN